MYKNIILLFVIFCVAISQSQPPGEPQKLFLIESPRCFGTGYIFIETCTFYCGQYVIIREESPFTYTPYIFDDSNCVKPNHQQYHIPNNFKCKAGDDVTVEDFKVSCIDNSSVTPSETSYPSPSPPSPSPPIQYSSELQAIMYTYGEIVFIILFVFISGILAITTFSCM
ncbi:hypothetical protein DICPUDRAFT_152347 [Dictyostelium purpureum]|uniref:Uncharacterized protein n=1 Tax=Dictyostelium purpureum TaxID=5786 RepID=F0ZL46_DICPU|nr:uncharacterized protein DICPUDRAFT_152347 [Dictyostelium purpureum]EGC35328.1 hypothetical protein DICPUDRAFT_152347 [Dictyostelium purpureum]|eukprot:XP_003288135.1 hypothetical protein DICPUDRAFT_152347 [Dictyostelium purpureum]